MVSFYELLDSFQAFLIRTWAVIILKEQNLVFDPTAFHEIRCILMSGGHG
jgi:hypothetical protein